MQYLLSSHNLDQQFVLQRSQCLDLIVLGLYNFAGFGLSREPLQQWNGCLGLLSLLLCRSISLYTVDEILLAARGLHMLYAYMNPLLDNTVPHLLVDLNANRPGGNVPHNPSPPLVEPVRHTLVDGTVHFDIYVVAESVRGEIFGERRQAMLSEGLREGVSSPRAITKGVRHDVMTGSGSGY